VLPAEAGRMDTPARGRAQPGLPISGLVRNGVRAVLRSHGDGSRTLDGARRRRRWGGRCAHPLRLVRTIPPRPQAGAHAATRRAMLTCIVCGPSSFQTWPPAPSRTTWALPAGSATAGGHLGQPASPLRQHRGRGNGRRHPQDVTLHRIRSAPGTASLGGGTLHMGPRRIVHDIMTDSGRAEAGTDSIGALAHGRGHHGNGSEEGGWGRGEGQGARSAGVPPSPPRRLPKVNVNVKVPPRTQRQDRRCAATDAGTGLAATTRRCPQRADPVSTTTAAGGVGWWQARPPWRSRGS
jgi:hypothetical protein